MERLASAGSSYLVTDQAGFNRASVAFVDVRQLGQSQVLLNAGCANVTPLALGKIRQDEACRGSWKQVPVTVNECIINDKYKTYTLDGETIAMNQNTILGKWIFTILSILFSINALLGHIANTIGVIEGVEKYGNPFVVFLTILSERWKEALGIAVVFIIVTLLLWEIDRRNQREDSKKLSWFDVELRNSLYFGKSENIDLLKCFFRQGKQSFLWWTVSGVAGIGKTRLVKEALREAGINKSDVQWLRSVTDYSKDNLRKTANDIVKSSRLRNIIVAEDAQIYMKNIGELIQYFAKMSPSDVGGHKIRLLLLIRIGEDENLEDRYIKLKSKSPYSVERTRYNESKEELMLQSYDEEEIFGIVKSFAKKTAHIRFNRRLKDDEITAIQTKVYGVLNREEVDPKHLRPLFAMFITYALLEGKDPMSWNRTKILDYAVRERGNELLNDEIENFQHDFDGHIAQKVYAIICLSIVEDGIAFSNLGRISVELENELKLYGKSIKHFLEDLQLLGRDDFIYVSMPDIISEYYVLRTLVIDPKKGMLDEHIRDDVIDSLITHSLETEAFRKKVRQDFRYLYDEIEDELDDFYYSYFKRCSNDRTLEIINSLLNDENDLIDTNAIIFHEAISKILVEKRVEELKEIEEKLLSVIINSQDTERKWVCSYELERLSKENEEATILYCKGLEHMIGIASEIEDKRECLQCLEELLKGNEANSEIVCSYAFGLYSMITYDPIIEKKRECISKLNILLDENPENSVNTKVIKYYLDGLNKMIESDSDIDNRRKYLKEIASLSSKNKEDINICSSYYNALVFMIIHDPQMKKKNMYLSTLECSSDESLIVSDLKHLYYYYGLITMIETISGLKEKRSYFKRLQELFDKNPKNAIIKFSYAMALEKMLIATTDTKEMRKIIYELSELTKKNTGIAEKELERINDLLRIVRYAPIIGKMTINVPDKMRLWDKGSMIYRLKSIYTVSLYNMIVRSETIEEVEKYLSELERVYQEHEFNSEFLLRYGMGLYWAYAVHSNWDNDCIYMKKLNSISDKYLGDEFYLARIISSLYASAKDKWLYRGNGMIDQEDEERVIFTLVGRMMNTLSMRKFGNSTAKHS